MKLLESFTNTKYNILKNKPSNVLKRIKMLISDFNPNRNGRVYSKELWEKAINSEYIKEMIDSHSLFGELNHPMGEEEDRLEIDLTKVSHAINNIWVDSEGVWGELDILPTPNGKIVNELIDYGSNIGISSRACGSLDSYGNVDPNDFQIYTWDIVARPSVENARFDQLMFESENIKPKVKKEIKNVLSSYTEDIKRDNLYTQEELKESVIGNITETILKESESIYKIDQEAMMKFYNDYKDEFDGLGDLRSSIDFILGVYEEEGKDGVIAWFRDGIDSDYAKGFLNILPNLKSKFYR